MTARLAKEEMALLMPSTLSHYFKDDLGELPIAEQGPSLFARLAAGLRWIGTLAKRQAVMSELSALSDHELADIGITRSEMTMVFDPEFAARRNNERMYARFQTGQPATV